MNKERKKKEHSVISDMALYWQYLFIVFALSLMLPLDLHDLTQGMSDWNKISQRDMLYSAAILSWIVIIIKYLKNQVINRFTLGLSLFVSILFYAVLTYNTTILDYYIIYNHRIPLICIVVVGVITTFFTPAGFIGVISEQKNKVYSASIKLLAASFFAAVLPIPLLPLGLLYLYYRYLYYSFEETEPRRWKFNW